MKITPVSISIRWLLSAFVALSILSPGHDIISGKLLAEEEEDFDDPLAAAEFRMLQLEDETGNIPPNALMDAVEQRKAMEFLPEAWGAFAPASGINELQLTAGIQPSSWTWLGPGNIGGRVRAIVVHPTTPSTMWAGSVGGGIWKTTNSGASWTPLADFMANLAVASMVIDPTDPNVLYAGTGEGFFNGDALRGAGIFKTTDGGTIWTQLASTIGSNFYFVCRLAISSNGSTLLAATSTGIWRSTDRGTTWVRTLTAPPDRLVDVDFNPADSTKAVCSGYSGLIYYSTNGGATWTAPITGVTTGGDRVEIAYAPSSPSIVYAAYDNATSNSGQLWKSTDGGVNFSLVYTGTWLSAQGWYDNALWVDPTTPNTVIVGGVDLWRSTNGGTSFTKISQWQSAPSSAHADNHVVVNHPGYNGSTNKTVFFGNDGGVYKATDVSTVALTSGWTELNNNFGVTQFYGAAGNASSGNVVGGTQDNGTLRYTTAGGTESWTAMFGGDGGFCAADSTDPNYFYGEYVYLDIHRSSNGGASSNYIYTGITDANSGSTANFIAPFILDPNNQNTMLGGGASLWRSTNVKAATPSWAAIKPSTGSFISAIAVAAGNSNIIWIGHNNGDVYYTTTGTAATPVWTRADLGAPNLPNRYCMRITIDPNNSSKVYVTFGGFNSDNIWRTTNNGVNWTNVGAGLPSVPVRSLVVSPVDSNTLYIGTEIGIFATVNGGTNWSPSNDGPANVSVDELFWMGSKLVAATHGRGIFTAIAIQPNLTPYQPAGWSNKIVVSNGTGTNTDSTTLFETDTLYVDWAVINNGTGATAAQFSTELYVDGVLRTNWPTPSPLAPNAVASISDYSIGNLPAGTHTIRIKTDAAGVIPESDETDNEFTKTIVTITPLQLVSATSVKTHGAAGTFGIPLPLSGASGVESRTGNGGVSGDHTLTFDFNTPIANGSAAVTTGAGSVSGAPTFGGNRMTVNLTGVADMQNIVVTLSGLTATNGAVLSAVTVPMGVLRGDVNGTRSVNVSDVNLVKAASSPGTVDPTNFRRDVNASGGINVSDVNVTKAASGNSIP